MGTNLEQVSTLPWVRLKLQVSSWTRFKKGKKTFNQRIDELSNRFLIKQDKGWYNLHPVAREIALQRLKNEPEELQVAHSKAADFYVRPFSSDKEVSKLGGFFVEARYHLVQAKRENELGKIAQNFALYWQSKVCRAPIPRQAENLDETIAVFLGLVDSTYYEEFEVYLARLFQARSKEGDLFKAWGHAKRATEYGYRIASWILRIDLELELYDTETALETCQKAIEQVSSSGEIKQLYKLGADLLIRLERRAEAMDLLRRGVATIQSEQGALDLYQRGTDLLAEGGARTQAIDWLKAGITTISPKHGLASLYNRCVKLLAEEGKLEEAIQLVEEGINRVQPEDGLASLYQVHSELLINSGELLQAIVVLRNGISNIPVENYPFDLYESCAELMIRVNDLEQAVALLKNSLRALTLDYNPIAFYERWGKLLANLGHSEAAIILLQEGIDSIPASRRPIELYKLCGDLLADLGRDIEAIQLLEKGIYQIPSTKGNDELYLLYDLCARLLVQIGETDRAVTLLETGIKKIRAQNALEIFYTQHIKILEKANRLHEAISILEDAILACPNIPKFYLIYIDILEKDNRLDGAVVVIKEAIINLSISQVEQVYRRAGKLFSRCNQLVEGINLLYQGFREIFSVNPIHSRRIAEDLMLYCLAFNEVGKLTKLTEEVSKNSELMPTAFFGMSLLAQMRGDWREAAEVAREGRLKVPNYMALAAQEAFCWLCIGNIKASQEAMVETLSLKHGTPSMWLRTFIALRYGNQRRASELLSIYLGREIQSPEEVSEQFLLALWDNSIDSIDTTNLSFYFPTLPPILTGLDFSVTRSQFGPAILPDSIKSMSYVQDQVHSFVGRDSVFISYSHKDDKWRQNLLTHLAPFIQAKDLKVWDDTQISPGAIWKEG
jgi:tetratricopeptide (TPR) repeat protein